ncbi:MAG: helix-turn-helix domain-containing protein [Egibacteraceae bacterium]
MLVVVGQWSAHCVRALRLALRMRQLEFAEHLDVAERTVRAWESGGRISLEGEQLLDVALKLADGEANVRFAVLTGAFVVWDPDSGAEREESATDRRQALQVVATGVAAVVVTRAEPLERVTTALERLRVDDWLLDGAHALTAQLGAGYDKRPAALLVGAVRGHTHNLFALLNSSMTPAQRQRLSRLAADSSIMLGALASSLDDRVEARTQFALAERLAIDVGDREARARALSQTSLLHSTVPHGGLGGDTQTALDLAQQAHALLPPQAPARTRSYLSARLALEHAADGDADACWRLMQEAAQRLAAAEVRGEPDAIRDGVFGAWNQDRLDRLQGLAGLLLAQLDRAETALARSLGQPVSHAERVRATADLARVHLLQDDPEQTCNALLDAWTIAHRVGYRAGRRRALGVHARFPRAWASLSRVRELDAQLQPRL